MMHLTVDSPVGALTIHATSQNVTELTWGTVPEAGAETPLLREAATQLAAYFARRLTAFDLPLQPKGTAFQNAVWREMLAIPYGQVRRYGELARSLDSAARAVGGACGCNPIPIIIPCHRVVAGTGLGGYSGKGKLETKRYLLALEGAETLPLAC
ncbi:MAG: methylated-DNA--[protein]-cysteine S-methyltransferase [Alphaproteobacteria bacterium]|nr:methylated-DNA--[protein]-cysteine S-methyltransferase [Alphaproteobacteria bacterium]